MKAANVNNSSRKTRKLIKKEFAEMLGEKKQLDKIYVSELCKRATGKTVYILDEPTIGLHTADVHKLIDVLQRLVDAGNTVIIIEHNMDVIKTADYIIDIGPEGGSGGGRVVVCGTPEKIAKSKKSYTGHFLKELL